MLSAASCVRAGVLVTWAALFGAHAASLLRPAGGRLCPGFEARVGQRVTYALLLDGQHGERTIGSCSVWCARAEDGYRVSSRAQLADASFIPGFSQLRATFAGGGEGGGPAAARSQVTLSLDEAIDAGGWLTAVDASASAFGLSARASAELTSSGIAGTWKAGDATNGAFSWASPQRHEVSALAVVSCLPAGLRLGTRFSIDLLGADLAGRQTALRQARFTVAGEEEIATAVGTLLLMRVDESGDSGNPAAQLWCDVTGLVYRQRFGEAGLTLELRSVDADRTPPRATSR